MLRSVVKPPGPVNLRGKPEKWRSSRNLRTGSPGDGPRQAYDVFVRLMSIQIHRNMEDNPMSKMLPPANTAMNPDAAKAASVYEALRHSRPGTREDLKNYVKVFLGVDVPDRRICPDHSSPMDYLWHSFSIDDGLLIKDDLRIGPADETPSNSPPSALNHPSTIIHHQSGDSLVWANRAGGKTELAAVATLLDAVFKPNCQIRILGGSGEQSGRMYEYLVGLPAAGIRGVPRGPDPQGQVPLRQRLDRRSPHAVAHQRPRHARPEAPLRRGRAVRRGRLRGRQVHDPEHRRVRRGRWS